MSALREYADTSDEMQDFCDTYFVKTEEAIEGLRLNCTDGHNAEWVEIAHQVKGSSGMIGAVELAKHCADAQQMPEVSEAERLAQLATIETSYQRTKAMFKANLAKVN
jgi:HPt (histidine-containing phosphotransfer) domain-containing protein